VFSQSISVSPCQYYCTNAPYSPSYTRCSYQKDERAKSGNLPTNSALSENGELWIQKYFQIFPVFKRLILNLASRKETYQQVLKRWVPLAVEQGIRWVPLAIEQGIRWVPLAVEQEIRWVPLAV
jgi:hypothetical protein